MVEYLAELGYAQPGDNGLLAISFCDIEAWARLTGLHLTAWLAVLLRELSKEYAYQASISGTAACPAPYAHKAIVVDMAKVRQDVDQKLRAMLSNG